LETFDPQLQEAYPEGWLAAHHQSLDFDSIFENFNPDMELQNFNFDAIHPAAGEQQNE
jgi:hypothetical protein